MIDMLEKAERHIARAKQTHNRHIGQNKTAFWSNGICGSSTVLSRAFYVPYLTQHHVGAFFIGILLGMGFNYTLSRRFVFHPFDNAVAGQPSKRKIV